MDCFVIPEIINLKEIFDHFGTGISVHMKIWEISMETGRNVWKPQLQLVAFFST